MRPQEVNDKSLQPFIATTVGRPLSERQIGRNVTGANCYWILLRVDDVYLVHC